MELDGTIRSMNQRIHKLLGYDSNDVVGRNIQDLIVPESSGFNFEGELLLDRLKDLSEGRPRAEITLPFRTRAGGTLDLMVTLDFVRMGFPMVFGRAAPTKTGILSQYVLSSSRELEIGNEIQLIDEISKTITEEASRCLTEEERLGVSLGVRETLMNSIEHGNLGISFEEKSKALEEDRLFDLIKTRQQEPGYRDRKIRVGYAFNQDELSIRIEDQGEGFDAETMLKREIRGTPEARRMHGRGIRITRAMFDEIVYSGKGNQVFLRKLFRKETNGN